MVVCKCLDEAEQAVLASSRHLHHDLYRIAILHVVVPSHLLTVEAG
jgi:hypothetical protein